MLILIPTHFEAGLLFGEAAAGPLRGGGAARVELGGAACDLALCGFGLAAAGAGAAHWIAALRPERVLLIGIAGSYDPDRAPIGTAIVGSEAICEGIGIGEGETFVSAEAAGWAQGHQLPGAPSVGDRLPLWLPPGLPGAAGVLVSVAAASAGPAQAARRAAAHRGALAEEMEGYAVALAARLAGVQLALIRGISNAAGDRDKTRWRAAEALAAARALAEALFSESKH